MNVLKDKRVLEIIDFLDETGVFDDGEITLLKDYLSGAVDKKVLERLNIRDMSHVSRGYSHKVSHLFRELEEKEKKVPAGKIGDFLFAAGGVSAKDFFEYGVLRSSEGRLLEGEPVKRAALWAACGVSLKELIETAENPENIREAIISMESLKDMFEGEARLLAAYFLMKYPKSPTDDGVKFETIDWMSKRGVYTPSYEADRGCNSEFDRSVEQQDAGLMERYEDLLISHIPKLYRGGLSASVRDELQEAVRQNRVDGRILGLVSHAQVDKDWMKELGGAAFANYELSSRLKNVAALCFAADTYKMLDIASYVDLRDSLKEQGGRFDELFGAEPPELIRWAAEHRKTRILEGQFERSRQAYLAYMDINGYEYLQLPEGVPLNGGILAWNKDEMDFNRYRMLSDIIRKKDPALYRERFEKALSRQREKVAQEILRNVHDCADSTQNAVRQYLDGKSGLEDLRAAFAKERYRYDQWGDGPWDVLLGYQEEYGHDSFMCRCETALMISKAVVSYMCLRDQVNEDRVKELFKTVEGEGLTLSEQLSGYEAMVKELERTIQITVYEPVLLDYKNGLSVYRHAAKQVFRSYLEKRRDEMLAAFLQANVIGRCFGAELLGEDPDRNKEEILELLQDPEKAVRDTVMELFYANSRFWEEEILSFLASRKADDRIIAALVFTKWNDRKYLPVLRKALEKEKSGKVMKLLETAVQTCAPEEAGQQLSREELVEKLHKGNKKRSLAWAYETPFFNSNVHKKNGEEADEQYLQAILLAYSAAGTASPEAAVLAEELEEKELAVYMGELFAKWMEAGEDAKKSWVLYAASIHGNQETAAGLQDQISQWLREGQNGMVSKAVRALAFSPEPGSLIFIDELSRKAKKESVRETALKALEAAQLRRGTTIDEMYERTVPDLGLDDNMQRVFDYGTRRFFVGINMGLEIEISDENGRKLKNLPAPGKRDDAWKAAVAREEFKRWKKQIDAVIPAQKKRLERALVTGRKWSIRKWTRLFVENFVMRPFAIGQVWGLYEDGKLTKSFRMEDGAFITEKQEKVALPDSSQEQPDIRCVGQIGLVHPIELSEDVLHAWQSQLEDHKISQPVEQLCNPVNYKTEEEMGKECLERFNGSVISDIVMGEVLTSLGWRMGPMTDSGNVYTYFRRDSEIAMETVLHFSGSFLGEEDEDVTVKNVEFYHLSQPSEGSDSGEAEQSVCPLKDVPDRYFSEIVLHISKALATD